VDRDDGENHHTTYMYIDVYHYHMEWNSGHEGGWLAAAAAVVCAFCSAGPGPVTAVTGISRRCRRRQSSANLRIVNNNDE
jgi:hypothetical protein